MLLPCEKNQQEEDEARVILTRGIGERIVIHGHAIGGVIVVTTLGFEGHRVRVSIQAPPHISVDREEIYVKKKAERRRDP